MGPKCVVFIKKTKNLLRHHKVVEARVRNWMTIERQSECVLYLENEEVTSWLYYKVQKFYSNKNTGEKKRNMEAYSVSL